MKKILFVIVALTILLTPTLLAYAAEGPSAANTTAGKQIDKLFQLEAKKTSNAQGLTKNLDTVTKNVSSKKEATYSDLFSSVAKTLTGVAVVLTFIGICVAGGMLIFASANEQQTEHAKTIMIYVVVGDIIIAASYIIIRAITKINIT